MDDSVFLTIVNNMAKKHNCEIDWESSNIETKTLYFIGGTDEEQTNLIMEMCDTLSDYMK